MIGLLARLLGRYLAGGLVTLGLLQSEFEMQELANDPGLLEFLELVLLNSWTLAGAGMSAVIEGAYALAKRFGWRT